MSSHPMQEHCPTNQAVSLTFAVMLIAALVIGGIVFEILPPIGWYQDHPFPARLSWFFPFLGNLLKSDWAGTTGATINARLDWLPGALWSQSIIAFDLSSAYGQRLLAVAITSVLSGVIAGVIFFQLSEPKDSLTHLSGRRLWRGYEAIRQAQHILKPTIKSFGRGLFIAPGLPIDQMREVQHVGLFGTTGSGKSTILRSLAEQILTRGDKVLFHDTKGDVLAGLPTESFILLAPHDSRGYAWDVARDIVTSQDARELATRLVRDSREPMWCGAARDILTGIIISLQREKPRTWSWQDLADAAFLPVTDLLALLQKFYPAASRYVEIDPEAGTPTRTTHGILITLWADIVGIAMPLASAWGNTPADKRLSLTAWITDESGKLPNVLILQRSPRHPSLSTAWIGAAVESLANVASGPDLPDSNTRRIWLLLDEFAQLGKLNAFRQLLEVGRSKGVACILALQDIQQLVGLYGDPVAKTILTLLGIKIIGKLPAGPSAAYVSNELVGQREVSWQEKIRSVSHGSGASSGRTVNYSTQTHRATVPVITPQQLESRLGVTRRGVRALLIGLGDVYELRWPLVSWLQRRSPTQAADWTKK